MRILLDECCNRRILRSLSGLDATTAQRAGWSGIRNGDLLRRMEGRFDVLVTQDQNLARQNTIAGRSFGLIVLQTKGGLWRELEPLMQQLRTAIERIQPGIVVVLGASTPMSNAC